MTETQLKTNCFNWYKKNYPYYIKKNEQVVKVGDPDVFICHKGVFVAIELKVGTNTPSELQKIKLEQIKQSKGVCGVAYSLEDFKNIIKEAEEYGK